MVQKELCQCSQRYATSITSIKMRDEIESFFEEQVRLGIYAEVGVTEPYQRWSDNERHKEYYASHWYKCCQCGCLWEIEEPDFPAEGFVRKFADGKYREWDFSDYCELINPRV